MEHFKHAQCQFLSISIQFCVNSYHGVFIIQGQSTHIDAFQTNIFSWFHDTLIQSQWFLAFWPFGTMCKNQKKILRLFPNKGHLNFCALDNVLSLSAIFRYLVSKKPKTKKSFQFSTFTFNAKILQGVLATYYFLKWTKWKESQNTKIAKITILIHMYYLPLTLSFTRENVEKLKTSKMCKNSSNWDGSFAFWQ